MSQIPGQISFVLIKLIQSQSIAMNSASSSGRGDSEDDHVFVRPAAPSTNRLEQGPDSFKRGATSGMQKRITNMDELEKWKNTVAHKQLLQFVQQLNHFAKDKSKGMNDYEPITLPPLIALRTLLASLTDLIEAIPPIQNDRGQRFGNKAFRTWIERMEALVDKFGLESEPPLLEDARQELCMYLRDSFGNYQRIDYGTGHELNFIIVLLGVYKNREFLIIIGL